ncbi:MAG: class I SAM-dependent rRNA methyltransferase [Rhabdochlamydiaceae bacterium]
MKEGVVLKNGRDKSLKQKHPWIFSGAIDRFYDVENGGVYPVYSAQKEFLALAYFHKDHSLCGRVLSFEDKPIQMIIRERLLKAFALREKLIDIRRTSCFRLVNAEGDGLPGLIIDQYNDIFVIQIGTLGIEKLKSCIVELLVSLFSPQGVYEKSHSSSRVSEGLPPSEGVLYGTVPDEIIVIENFIKFKVCISKSQKTGLFLDQREMRQLVYKHSQGKKVLNLFSYSAGFSLYAMAGGALNVTSVDIDDDACSYALDNTVLNGFSKENHHVYNQDVFKFLNQKMDHDFIILDPPAFAKKRKDIDNACKGYLEINKKALKGLPPSSLLLTCSCSYYISSELFQNLVFQASQSAERNVRIVSSHVLAQDHPISIYHKEGSYLKSLLLFVD